MASITQLKFPASPDFCEPLMIGEDWHEDIKRLLIRCGGQNKEVWSGVMMLVTLGQHLAF